ncbi:MAG: thrombospondin type 3 repeat-containing protein, partial [Chloroflexi bacterium]|nr:thrombospondin type 3 repeat-containing protein [Chloroflexota bacterium]
MSDPAGFVRLLVPPGDNVLASTPFYAFDPTINALLYGQLTGGTNADQADAVSQWTGVSDLYAYKFTNGWWYEDFTNWTHSDLEFYPGNGFVLYNRQAQTQAVFLFGAVVLDSTNSLDFASGLTRFGYPYTAKIGLNGTTLQSSGAAAAAQADAADQITNAATGERAWLFSSNNLWVNDATNATSMELLLGQGYGYQRILTNTFTWTEDRPYGNAFSLGTNFSPAIVDMGLTDGQDGMILGIHAAGIPGELLEVYYQDIAPTGSFVYTPWAIAEKEIAVGGTNYLEWTDEGGVGRGSVTSVYARCYLVGRGDIDSDNDSLPDARERFVLGTEPLDSDSDNDGVQDGTELEFGQNPSVSNAYFSLPFEEGFETNTVTLGEINAQHGWMASPLGTALVQTNSACTNAGGNRALWIDNATNSTAVRHLFVQPTSQVVWADMWVQAFAASAPTGAMTGTAAYRFDSAGRLVVYDGTNQWLTLTNHPPVPTCTWARVTVKLNYADQDWSLFLNAGKVATNLGFATPRTEFAAFGMDAGRGLLDNLLLSTSVPPGIDEDQDGLPDVWEIQYFGNLSHGAGADDDGDGLTNLQEYQAGTDPTEPDSDGDGMSDANELIHGPNPLSPDSYMSLPFVEDFETNTCVVGELNGQNGWTASPAGCALVQTNDVQHGEQALAIESATNGPPCVAKHLFAEPADSMVWCDMHTK